MQIKDSTPAKCRSSNEKAYKSHQAACDACSALNVLSQHPPGQAGHPAQHQTQQARPEEFLPVETGAQVDAPAYFCVVAVDEKLAVELSGDASENAAVRVDVVGFLVEVQQRPGWPCLECEVLFER